MRKFLLLLLLGLPLSCPAQDDAETGVSGAPRALPAGPAVQQDAEAAREKLLKSADQIDMIQSNAETTRVAVEAMKNDIAQLQAANTDLKQQLAALQAAFDKSQAEQARQRQAIVDEVAQLVASHSSAPPKPAVHHHADPDAATSPSASSNASTEVHHAAAPDPAASSSNLAPPSDPAPPKPRQGYFHTVESGETLTMICEAFHEKGVKVSIAAVRKANGLTAHSVLKVGQKLFIPKPGA